MAVLTQQSTVSVGLEATYDAADAAGDVVPFHADLVLHVINTNAAARTVTVLSSKACNQGFVHPQVVVIPAGQSRFIGPFESRFIQSDNNIGWTYDAVTDVTIAALVV